MPNTYTQIYIHAVFAVKYRNAVIEKKWRSRFMEIIANLINETACKSIIVNGVEDHVHCLFSLKANLSLSDVMKIVKSKSSKALNEIHLLSNRFEWQRGFGAFSYSKSQINEVYKYIQNQEQHHQKETFKEEYTNLLIKFEVQYDKDWYFEEMI